MAALLRVISAEVLSKPIELDDVTMATILSPRHFVEVRTTPGGPAPSETSKAIEESKRRLEADRAWLSGVSARLSGAEDMLKAAVRAL